MQAELGNDGRYSLKKVLSDFTHYLSDNKSLGEQVTVTSLAYSIVNKCSCVKYLVKQKFVDQANIFWAAANYFDLILLNINIFKTKLMPPNHIQSVSVTNEMAYR